MTSPPASAGGDRVGIIGPNGAGKSTLVKILIGEIEPDEGTVRQGAGLSMAYLDQSRAALANSQTVKDALSGGNDFVDVQGHKRHVASYAKDFLFAPGMLNAPVRSLSGGERNRLLLARTLAQPANFFILDEPTNDLDMDTLDLLEDMLGDYTGTVLLVSHDRDFLDRIVTSTIVLEGDGAVTEYAGGYSDYLRQSQTPEEKSEKPKSRPAPRTDKPASTSKRLSFKHKRRLETLPYEMKKAEEQAAILERALADPDFYRHDPAGFERTGKALEVIQGKLQNMEEEWLELEIQREEAER